MSCSRARVASAKMLRMSSSTISTFLPASTLVGLVQVVEHLRASPRAVAPTVRCRTERRLVEQPLGRVRRRCTRAARRRRAASARRRPLPASPRRRSPAAAADRRLRSTAPPSSPSARRRHRADRRPRSRRVVRCERLERRVAVGDRDDLDVARRRAARRARSRAAGVGLDDQQRASSAASTKSLSVSSSRVEHVLRLDRLGEEADRARPAARARATSSVEITQTGMWRVARSFLSRSSTRQPSMSGRKMSSVIAVGLVLARQRQRAGAAACVTRPLKPLLARRVEQEPGEAEVVLDDQQHAVAGLDVVAVVVDLVDEQRRLRRSRRLGAGAAGASARRRRRSRVGRRAAARRRSAACGAAVRARRAAACSAAAGTA